MKSLLLWSIVYFLVLSGNLLGERTSPFSLPLTKHQKTESREITDPLIWKTQLLLDSGISLEKIRLMVRQDPRAKKIVAILYEVKRQSDRRITAVFEIKRMLTRAYKSIGDVSDQRDWLALHTHICAMYESHHLLVQLQRKYHETLRPIVQAFGNDDWSVAGYLLVHRVDYFAFPPVAPPTLDIMPILSR